MDIMTQHLRHLRAGEPILKPVYQHTDGTFGPATYVEPHGFTVLEGLLGYHTDELCDLYDVRVYLAPPEALRRKWKVDRDCSRRGYTTDQVLAELDRREADSAAFIRPQQRHADMVVSFQRADDGERGAGRRTAAPPGLRTRPLAVRRRRARRDHGRGSRRRAPRAHPGDRRPGRRGEIEEAVWEKMHFARTCAPIGWASTRSARSCTARSRWRSSSCSSSTSW